MNSTYTKSETDTYSESRANYATGKVYEVLMNMAGANLISYDRADKWKEDLLFLQRKRAINFFEFQFKNSSGEKIGGLRYKVSADNTIITDDDSGGLNFWGAAGAKVTFFVSIDWSTSHSEEVQEYTENWGAGTQLDFPEVHQKSFSKKGYGFNESKLGDW